MTIFRKTLTDWSMEDVQSIIGLAESETLEFKQDLAVEAAVAKKGGRDAWYDSRKIGREAKKDIAKEIIAFANSGGGHLILGISEAKADNENLADEISPLPDVLKLASQLQNSLADSIEPKLLSMKVRGIETDEDCGIIVFDVRSSISAPHRSKLDWKCYFRRWDRSEAMTMNEIQELTRSRDRQEAEIRKFLSKSRDKTRELIGDKIPGGFPICVTIGIILNEKIDIGLDLKNLPYAQEKWDLDGSHRQIPSIVSMSDGRPRPVLSGLRWRQIASLGETGQTEPFALDLLYTGRLSAGFRMHMHNDGTSSSVYLGHAAATMLFIFDLFLAFVKDHALNGSRACWMVSTKTSDVQIIQARPISPQYRAQKEIVRRGDESSEVMEFEIGSTADELANLAFRDMCHMLGVEAFDIANSN